MASEPPPKLSHRSAESDAACRGNGGLRRTHDRRFRRALIRRDVRARPAVPWPPTRNSTPAARESRNRGLDLCRRQPWRRPARNHAAMRVGHRSERRRPCPRTLGNVWRRWRAIGPAAQADPRAGAHGRSGYSRHFINPCLTLMRRTIAGGRLPVWKGDEEVDAIWHLAVPLASYLQNGNPAHLVLHPSDVLAPRTSNGSSITPTPPISRTRYSIDRRPADSRQLRRAT